jgi:hypothetical protein
MLNAYLPMIVGEIRQFFKPLKTTVTWASSFYAVWKMISDWTWQFLGFHLSFSGVAMGLFQRHQQICRFIIFVLNWHISLIPSVLDSPQIGGFLAA